MDKTVNWAFSLDSIQDRDNSKKEDILEHGKFWWLLVFGTAYMDPIFIPRTELLTSFVHHAKKAHFVRVLIGREASSFRSLKFSPGLLFTMTLNRESVNIKKRNLRLYFAACVVYGVSAIVVLAVTHRDIGRARAKGKEARQRYVM